MAGRPPKRNLDFAGWNVDIFDNDSKIDKLLDAQGWDGFGIYFYLCQRAYGSDGYYYKWGYDDCATTARKMGGGISSGTVKETVGYCLRIGLFDKELFDRWGILTSNGIQRKYWIAIKDRSVKTVIVEYWLLQNNECEGLLKEPLKSNLCPLNINLSEENGNNHSLNGDYVDIKESKEKESKEKESKEKESKEEHVPEPKYLPISIPYQEIANMYNLICKSFSRLNKLSDARKKAIRARMNTYELKDFEKLFQMAESSDFLKGKNDRNWSATFDWLIADANMAKVLDGNYANKSGGKNPTGPKPNAFHNFEQRKTDYEAMAMDRLKERMRNTGGES